MSSKARIATCGVCVHAAVAALSIGLAACQGTPPPDQGLTSPEVGACARADGVARAPIIGEPELCGNCDPHCYRTLDAPDDGDLTDANTDDLVYDETAGGLVLGPGGTSTGGRFAYVANAPDSTVSKMSLETGAEVGRYLVGNSKKRCDSWSNGCNQPSRTAVDARGYGYVANRAFGGQGTVTKLAGEVSTCVDRNLNGAIETSSGSVPLAWGADECVIWTVNVGGWDGIPRALAVDAADRLWVGLYNERRFYVLNLNDGSLIGTVDVDGQPYGAAIGGDGKLWYPNGCCGRSYIQAVDTATLTEGVRVSNTTACDGSYGIVVDTKNRVTIGGYPENCVARYDPAAKTWQAFWTKQAKTATRGVTIDANDAIWTASHDNVNAHGPHWISRFLEDGTELIYTVPGCGVPIGLAADFTGHMWTVCQTSSKIARIEIATGHTKTFDTGPNPYTYSDFTGFLRATVTAPEGHYIRLHDSNVACTDDREAYWTQLYFDVETPTGTTVTFFGRTAETTAALTFADEFTIATVPGDISPIRLPDVLDAAGIANNQRYLEVRVRLQSTVDGVTPVFSNMTLVHQCQCTCDADATCTAGCDCDEDC